MGELSAWMLRCGIPKKSTMNGPLGYPAFGFLVIKKAHLGINIFVGAALAAFFAAKAAPTINPFCPDFSYRS